jgi:hypothetical protein
MHTTYSYQQSLEEPRKFLWLRGSVWLFALGVIAGYLWNAPVFTPPGSQPLIEQGFSFQRILRVFSVMLILPLVWNRLFRLLLLKQSHMMILFVFVFAPLLSLLNYPDISFLIATIGPFVVGGVSLMCLCALSDDEFKTWVTGVGFASLVFLLLGLKDNGIETTTFYGSDRASFGFIHPTQSAAVVLMSGGVMFYFVSQRLQRHLTLRKLLLTGIAAFTACMLLLAMSKNTMLIVILTIICASYATVFKSMFPRFLLSIVLISSPILIFAYAIYGDKQDIIWLTLNFLSSDRFEAYRTLLSNMNNETFFTIFLGPSAFSQSDISGNLRGFASSESVYFSLYVNFGIVTLLSFFTFLLILAKRLSKIRSPLAFGGLCGITIFIAIDAQGVTPSNLAIFSLLAYCVRNTMQVSNERQLHRQTATLKND